MRSEMLMSFAHRYNYSIETIMLLLVEGQVSRADERYLCISILIIYYDVKSKIGMYT